MVQLQIKGQHYCSYHEATTNGIVKLGMKQSSEVGEKG